MLSLSDLRTYQHYGVGYALRHPYCALFLGMGLGKTVISLTAISSLLSQGKCSRVLVLAPLRAAKMTWPNELKEFSHLAHLRASIVIGTEKQRIDALKIPADIYIMNHENIVWLVKKLKKKWPFDIVIVDESSYYKNHESKRFRALRFIRPFVKRLILLTGTPVSNSYLDLWSQIFLLDQGKRLEDGIGKFRKKYFDADEKQGYTVYSLKEGEPLFLGVDFYEKMLFDKIRDVCVSMDTRAYVELPPVSVFTTYLDLGDKFPVYEKFRRDKLIENPDISAVTAGVLAGKLKQFTGGQVYDEEKAVHTFHDIKIVALKELLGAANGEPVIVFYWYQHERERIIKELKGHKISELKKDGDLKEWNNGKIDILLLQPRSAGHGLNLQKGGHIIIWYSLPFYSQELFQQANKRLDRSGQTKPVFIYVLLTQRTVEVDEYQVILGKMTKEQALLNAVKANV